jgi:NAD(P)-dependent dehydrogenase (short-subunit alcohol dehydrogenase family)
MTTVLVTGINGPMGQVISRRLNESGWRVLGTDRHTEPTPSIQMSIDGYFCADFERDEELSDLAVWATEKSDETLSLVNNAAYTTEANSTDYAVHLPEQSIRSFVKALQINLTAPFALIQALAPKMLQGSNSSIVNITSTYGLVGPQPSIYQNVKFFNSAGYAASKGGLHQLTKYFATILAPNVRVNSVAPGGIERGHDKDFVKRYTDLTPLGRMNSEIDVANAVDFLLSQNASYITGQSLSVDGGWTTW